MNLPNINKRKIVNLLKEDKRFDKRKPFDYRDVEIETEISINAEGTARVRLGKTEVIVGVKMDTQTPYSDHEDEGTMIVGMEFSPVSGERYENGPPQMDSIEIARVVDRGIRESGFINWKGLCITPKEKVWSVMIDIYCINDDGNVMDASAMGAVAALKMTKFPIYDEVEGKVKHGESSGKYLPLTKNNPLAMTFHKIGEKLLLDPNRDEEDASEARVTVAVYSNGKDKIISSMQKGGITPLTIDDMNKVIEECEKNYDSLFPKLDKMANGLIK